VILTLALLIGSNYAQEPVIDCQFEGNLTNDGNGEDPTVDIGQISYVDGAAVFDGDTGLEVPGSGEYADGDFTIEIMAYFDSAGIDQQQFLIGNYYKAGGAESEPTVYLRYQGDRGEDDDNDHKFKFFMREQYEMRELELFHEEDRVEMEQWYRLTVRKSDDNVSFWINGELAATNNLDLNPNNDYVMSIGKQANDGNPNRLQGMIDYLQMWTVALPDDSLGLSVDDNQIEILPTSFHISSVYPNPFNAVTNLKVEVAKSGFISFYLHDVTGKQVQPIWNGELTSGNHTFSVDGSRLSAGNYIVHGVNSQGNVTRNIVLLK